MEDRTFPDPTKEAQREGTLEVFDKFPSPPSAAKKDASPKQIPVIENIPLPPESPKKNARVEEKEEKPVSTASTGNQQVIEEVNSIGREQTERSMKAIENIDESLLPEVPDAVVKMEAKIKDMKKNGLLGAPDVTKMWKRYGGK